MIQVETAELLRRVVDSRTADIWTCFSGRIEKYDAVTRTADIAPVICRVVPAGALDETGFEGLPVLPNVPVRFPIGGGGTYAITWPLQVGDFVDVYVTTTSQAQWRRTGEIGFLGGDTRTHNLSSCYAVPGACPNTQALDQAQTLALVVEGPEIRLGKNASDFVALASKVLTELNKVKSAMTSAVVVPNDGGASLKTTFLAALNFASVAATKVKGE